MLYIVPGGQEVGPDVKRLIGQLEEAEDAVGGGAAGVAVAGDDAVFMEHLGRDSNTRLTAGSQAPLATTATAITH